jgi:hypothetical protein
VSVGDYETTEVSHIKWLSYALCFWQFMLIFACLSCIDVSMKISVFAVLTGWVHACNVFVIRNTTETQQRCARWCSDLARICWSVGGFSMSLAQTCECSCVVPMCMGDAPPCW